MSAGVNDWWESAPSATDAARRCWDDDDWEAGITHCVSMLSTLLASVPDRAPVVDFGCGVGRLIRPMCARLNVYGYEPSVLMRMSVADDDTSTRVFGPDGLNDHHEMFAAAYSTLVFQHLDDVRATWAAADLARLLRPGGLAVVQYVAGDPQAQHRVRAGALAWDASPTAMAALFARVGLSYGVDVPDPVYPSWRWMAFLRTGDQA